MKVTITRDATEDEAFDYASIKRAIEAVERSKPFVELPPQGYQYMTTLQRLDHNVRVAIVNAFDGQKVGKWNVEQVLRGIIKDMHKKL